MAAYSGLTLFLGSEGVGHPSRVASNYDAVDMASILTVEVIRTSLVATKREGVICIQTLVL